MKIKSKNQRAGGKEIAHANSAQTVAERIEEAVTSGPNVTARAVDTFLDGAKTLENAPKVSVQNAPKPSLDGAARASSPYLPRIDTAIEWALNATFLLHSYIWPQEFAVVELTAAFAAAFFAEHEADPPAASLRGVWAAVRSGQWYAPQSLVRTLGLPTVSSAASAANYHQTVGSICSAVNNWVVSDAAGTIKPAEVRPLNVIRNIIADYKAMPVPRDEFATEECNVL
ncbi:MAG: hypothetical protein EOO38_31780, partial [Cytophagaceae bacterium]